MGAFKLFSSGSKSNTPLTRVEKEYIKISPNPRKFQIHKTNQIGKYLIAMVIYPDCINYNGFKVLVFCEETQEQFKDRKKIDPHFFEESNIIARFKPDDFGWECATLLCLELTKRTLK